MTIDTKLIPTASLKRAIACLEHHWRMNTLISKEADSEQEQELAIESAAIYKAAAGDLMALLDMANNANHP